MFPDPDPLVYSVDLLLPALPGPDPFVLFRDLLPGQALVHVRSGHDPPYPAIPAHDVQPERACCLPGPLW